MNGKSYAAANTKSTQHRTSSRRPALPALSFRREFSKGILPASFDVVFRFSCHSERDPIQDAPRNLRTVWRGHLARDLAFNSRVIPLLIGRFRHRCNRSAGILPAFLTLPSGGSLRIHAGE